MANKIGIGILGGTGYGAGELLRILAQHNQSEVLAVVSSSQAGESISDVHGHLQGFYSSLRFESSLPFDRFEKFEQTFIFAALPHGKSAETIQSLLDDSRAKNFKVIDLSGDFRLQSEVEHKKFYPEVDTPEALRSRFAYGLTESNRAAILSADCVANPGCLASSCALAVLPLVSADFRGAITFDAKTGTSGAGRTPTEVTHHPGRHANVNAYKILEHRHEPEIRQALGDPHGDRIETTFVPHLLPISRGIFTTAYLHSKTAVTTPALREIYSKFYADCPFVRVREESPQLQNVVGSNFCDIAVFARGKQIVAMAALDNLVKGMAGQAIQNMNLMAGLPETTGLLYPGISLI